MGKITTIFLSIIFSLFLLEIILSFTPLKKKIYKGFPINYYEKNSDYGYDIKKNTKNFNHLIGKGEYKYNIWGNKLGCFDDKNFNIDDGYVLSMGDSTSWGYTSNNTRWNNLLEKKIDYPVLSCGVSGFSTKQQLMKTKRIIIELNKMPKIIILQYSFQNDLFEDSLFPFYTIKYGQLSITKKYKSYLTGEIQEIKKSKLQKKIRIFLRSHSYLYNLLDNAFYALKKNNKKKNISSKKKSLGKINISYPWNTINYLDPQKYNWVKLKWDNHLDNLRDFKKFADNNEIDLYVVYIEEIREIYHMLENFNKFSDLSIKNNSYIIKKFFKDNSITFFDLENEIYSIYNIKKKYFKKHPLRGDKINLVWLEDGHYNTKGNKLIAELIYKDFVEGNFLLNLRK